MPRWARRVAAVVLVVALAYGATWLLTPYSGIARSIAWLEADTGDIDRFPARVIAAGTEPRALEDDPWAGAADVTVGGEPEPLDDFLQRTGTDAFLVARGDRIVDERYFGAQTADDLHTSFSVGKSFLSAAVGSAVDRGLLDLDEPVTTRLPELAERDPRFAAITLEDLLTMSSGIAYREQGLPWSDDALTYYAGDLRKLALTDSEVAEPPGRWHYNNYNPLLVALLLERATGQHVTEVLADAIWEPAGMESDASWSLDSRRSGFEKSESGLNAVPRDYLRFGMLFRDGGLVDGRQVLPQEWVERSTTGLRDTRLPATGYGLFWWTGPEGTERFSARGNHGQFIFVYPEHDLVMVRLGSGYGHDGWSAVFDELAAAYANA